MNSEWVARDSYNSLTYTKLLSVSPHLYLKIVFLKQLIKEQQNNFIALVVSDGVDEIYLYQEDFIGNNGDEAKILAQGLLRGWMQQLSEITKEYSYK